ncbi:glyoxalase [Knoellia sinensis KCTC 19936]|uniref:Glyoxalase n=1 Tax=Knoellia sinensis KCTC 19936 TaxID=1385520 RepID=A0A0A0JBC9_9MICO|nr:VOC family protein [Knoellia sinensis]KGN34720.1 glyoxalase [Knoellia sinensis KCTC 19936]
MIGERTPVTCLGVSDLQRARDFYEGTLGFSPGTDMLDQGITYQSGSGTFFVYQSEFAGTNKATAMMFEVPGDAFDAEISALRDKGVEFQTWEAEGTDWTDGVASMADGAFKSVWFADPDGNIINVGSQLPS